MNIFRSLAVACLFAFACPNAYAGGDLTDYKPLPVVGATSSCGGPFSGWYGGVVLGGGELDSKATADSNIGATTRSFKDNDRGFTVGGVGGYNWQCNGRLLGVESDISYFNADAVPGVFGSGCPGCAEERANFGSEINWFGTLRARLGLLAADNFLVFATGGLAYGGVDHSITFTGPVPTPFAGGNLGSISDTNIGWTAGGGIEFLLADNWSFRADALYVDLGSEDHTFTTTTGDGCPCSASAKWDDNFWVARVGLTYLFGAPTPVAYAPLK